ncbi:MAG: AAA family ATPase [Acidithiobacillus ferriphilus]
MLIEFSVANFRSIEARQTLSMVASADAAHLQHNVSPVQEKNLRLLRSAAIYGPNAAGKSNLLRAVETLRQMVWASAAGQEGQRLPVVPFLLSKESTGEPSAFEILFMADDGVRYHYACEVSPERVYKEWLVAYPHGRPQRWFEREYVPQTQSYDWWFGPNFKGERKEREVWQNFTRSNALFLSTAIQFNNAQLRPTFTWITQRLIVLLPGVGVNFNPALSLELLQKEKNRVMHFMHAADIGIDRLDLQEEDLVPAPPSPGPVMPGTARLRIEIGLPPGEGLPPGISPQIPKAYRVMALHKMLDANEEVPLDIIDESDGTRKLFEYVGGWVRALDWGATLLVDELDRSLHPFLTRFLIERFNNTANEKNAQLVFTTHDTTLLDPALLRRDQIWFVEKDKRRSTHLYSLLDYSPRKDEALERGYLKGRYGAIPFIGTLWED